MAIVLKENKKSNTLLCVLVVLVWKWNLLLLFKKERKESHNTPVVILILGVCR